MLDHPYFVAVQYHPEYISRPLKPSAPYLGLIWVRARSVFSRSSHPAFDLGGVWRTENRARRSDQGKLAERCRGQISESVLSHESLSSCLIAMVVLLFLHSDSFRVRSIDQIKENKYVVCETNVRQ